MTPSSVIGRHTASWARSDKRNRRRPFLRDELFCHRRRSSVNGQSGMQQILLEKQSLDAFSNPQLPGFLQSLGADRFVVYGVVTEICVKFAVSGLLRTGKRVELVTDAVRHLNEDEAQQMMRELEKAGGALTTTARSAHDHRIALGFAVTRTIGFQESVIRDMSRRAMRYGAVNLAQGFPDFPAPEVVKRAAMQAIDDDINQYANTWGAKPLRNAIARKYQELYGLEYDPEAEITVCCGATEGMIASLLAVTNPGDEIVVFEPFYENYRPDASALRRGQPACHACVPRIGAFDPDELRAAFSSRTKAIILNSPNNPTGRVFTREELSYIAALAQEFDTLVITDEIYEHILYDGAEHIPMATLPDMRARTLIVNSMSKTYSVTGWRIGWVMAPAGFADAIRKVHDFLTVGAAAPLQQAGAEALAMPDAYFSRLARTYTAKRDLILRQLDAAGIDYYRPQGAYYVLCDISKFGFPNDIAFTQHLIENIGVACVPGSSFFSDPASGAGIIRFCFCKKEETLLEAGARLIRGFQTPS